MLGAGASTSARTSAGTSADTRTSTRALILPVNLLIFWDWIACELITLFVISFHAIISPDYRFFFEVPRIEELQDPDSSPRREEVGRRTLRDYGGFLLSFFYRARFQLFTSIVENPLSTFTK